MIKRQLRGSTIRQTHSCESLCLRDQLVDLLRVVLFLFLYVGHGGDEMTLSREMRLRVAISHVAGDRL